MNRKTDSSTTGSAAGRCAGRVSVSIVIPMRNEDRFIGRCLDSILSQVEGRDDVEILCVDGASTDRTREIVSEYTNRYPRVRLIDNPRKIVPIAMNLAISQARGDVIIRVDGHVEVAEDFVAQSVRALREHPEAWCVGGPVETVNTTFVGKAIAGAMSSPVGVGNAMFRLGDYEGYVDTLAFGAYWRWVFDKIGTFDEELVRNQDDELNMRLILAGGKIFMTPKIASRYFARTSLRKLARQYFQYGFWRIRTIQKHRRPATLRQIAPLAFVLIWMALVIGTLVYKPIIYALTGFAGLYLLGLLAGTLDVIRKAGIRCALLAPLIFIILHFYYGAGSLKGIWTFYLLRKKRPFNVKDHPLSR